MLNVAMVGAGSFAQQHLASLSNNPAVRLRWVCDVNESAADRTARDFSVERATVSFEDVLADDQVDLVDLVTPVHLHAPQAIAALTAGKSVICEKPMALSLAQAEEMVSAAQNSKGQLFIKYHQRFDPVHELLRSLVTDQTYGRALVAHFKLIGDHLAALQTNAHWRGDPRFTGGGCLFESGAHLIDLMHFVFGPARRVTAAVHQQAADNPDKGEDTASVIIEFGATVLTLVGYWGHSAWAWEKQVFTSDRSMLEVQTAQDNVLIHHRGTEQKMLLTQPDWFNRSIDSSLTHYVNCVSGLEESRFTLAEQLEPMRTLDAGYRSAREGRTVELT